MPSFVSELIINPFKRRIQQYTEKQRQRRLTSRAARDNHNNARQRRVLRDDRPNWHATTPTPGIVVLDIDDRSPPSSAFSRNPTHIRPTGGVNAAGLMASPTARDRTIGSHSQTQPPDQDNSDLEVRPATPVAQSPSNKRHNALPEDDGMGTLRKRMLFIQQQNIPQADKARMMHQTIMEGYFKANPTASSPTSSGSPDQGQKPTMTRSGESWGIGSPPSHAGTLESLKFWQSSKPKATASESAQTEQFYLTPADVEPTYAIDRRTAVTSGARASENDNSLLPLGCQHYRRNVKLQCSTCNKWYTCRFCHDEVEDHKLIRQDTKHMLCMMCATPQKAAEICIKCQTPSARYFCNICKLWDDHPNKNIYHCNECGICRRGQGLGKDFFHCKKCCACISIAIQASHKCIERSTDCDCPICGEYMFTSPNPVVFMACGHSIHSKCYDQHMLRSYKCPICNKSLLNMESQFRQLEVAIQNQPMPSEFRDTKSTILCNDCSGKSTVPYHWLGLKCAICNSYNTVELQMSRTNDPYGQSGASSDVPATSSANTIAPQREAATPTNGTVSGPGVTIPRRRFSSAIGPDSGLFPQSRRGTVDERLARSASPAPPPPMQMRLPFLGGAFSFLHDGDDAEDTDEDMLGLWGTRTRQSQEGDVEGDDDDLDSLSSDDNDEYEDDDDDDDDDDNDIILIGHR